MRKRTYVPAMRPEPDTKVRWSLYSVEGDLWLPVIFHSEREAAEAAKVINRGGQSAPNAPRS